ncbi:MAG: hypothetical protein ACTSPY_15750 [Candidatus Helarchaeota archaeon]
MNADNPLGTAEEEVELISNIIPSVIFEKNMEKVPIDIEYATVFSFIEYDRRRNDILKNSKYLSFKKLLWPMIVIQKDTENYIFIDNLNYFSLQFKIYKFEKLKDLEELKEVKINDFNSIQENITIIKNVLDDSYSYNKKINGLIEPEIIKGISPLIKLSFPESTSYSLKIRSDKNQHKLTEIVKEYLESINYMNKIIEILENTKKLLNDNINMIEKVISRYQTINKDQTSLHFNHSINLNEIKSVENKLIKLIDDLNKKISIIHSEREYLKRWSISGSKIDLILPILRIWLPLYVAKIQTSSGNINWIVAPPLIIQTKSEREIPIDVFNPSFLTSLKDRIENNFSYILKFIPETEEFDLFKDDNVNKLISEGFEKLLLVPFIDKKFIDYVKRVWIENLKI